MFINHYSEAPGLPRRLAFFVLLQQQLGHAQVRLFRDLTHWSHEEAQTAWKGTENRWKPRESLWKPRESPWKTRKNQWKSRESPWKTRESPWKFTDSLEDGCKTSWELEWRCISVQKTHCLTYCRRNSRVLLSRVHLSGGQIKRRGEVDMRGVLLFEWDFNEVPKHVGCFLSGSSNSPTIKLYPLTKPRFAEFTSCHD